jgi:hypothetical protein
MSNSMRLISLVLMIALQGCLAAPEPAATTPPATGGTTSDKTDTSKTDASKTDASKTDASKTDTGLSDIRSSSLMVTQGSSKVSLADIAKKSTAELVVFQFYGVTCLSCMTEGPFVSDALAKYGSKVQTYVIFPNARGEYTTAQYEGFTKSYANSSPYAVDETLETLKSVRVKASQFFGIYVLVAKSGQGVKLTADEASKTVEPAVKKALGQ